MTDEYDLTAEEWLVEVSGDMELAIDLASLLRQRHRRVIAELERQQRMYDRTEAGHMALQRAIRAIKKIDAKI